MKLLCAAQKLTNFSYARESRDRYMLWPYNELTEIAGVLANRELDSLNGTQCFLSCPLSLSCPGSNVWESGTQ